MTALWRQSVCRASDDSQTLSPVILMKAATSVISAAEWTERAHWTSKEPMNIKQPKIKHSYTKISHRPLKPPTAELRPPQILTFNFRRAITVGLMSLLEGRRADFMQSFILVLAPVTASALLLHFKLQMFDKSCKFGGFNRTQKFI